MNTELNSPNLSTKVGLESIHRSGIRRRLLMGFAAVAIITIIAISATLVKVDATEKTTGNLLKIELPIYDNLLDLAAKVSQTQSDALAFILTQNNNLKNEIETNWIQINVLKSSIDEFSKNQSKVFSNRWQEATSLINELKVAQTKLINTTISSTQVIQPKISELMLIEDKFLTIVDGPLNSAGIRTGGIMTMQYEKLEAESNSTIHNMNLIKNIGYSLLLLVILASVFISILTARSIINPINKAIDIAKKIAAGSRNIKIPVNSFDETGELLIALSTMQEAIKNNEIKLKKNEEQTRTLLENILHTAQVFSTHSSKVAAGDLTERLEAPNEDTMLQLGKDLNVMTESLASITKQITQASHDMVTTIEEVKQAVNMQSSGATEQATSINEITASLEEIEKSSAQTMDKAKALGDAAERTRQKGAQGLEAVEQSIRGMKAVREKVQMIAQTILDLSNQTQQVGEITAVVNTLAQQSKMLALNASIEAAKAGEAGKGFAVVASEVKNLAEQSEQSTTQVQKILEDIRHAAEKAVMVTEEGTKGVDHGTGLVEQTGDIVRNLSEVIHETTIASQQIEAAVRQESVGIEQITAGMNEINQVTISFVSSVKQTTEAIANLASIAKNLKERVDAYKI